MMLKTVIPKAWVYQRLVDVLIPHGYPHMSMEKIYELAPELYEVAKRELPDLEMNYETFIETMKFGEHIARQNEAMMRAFGG
jgi:hypothetical protein